MFWHVYNTAGVHIECSRNTKARTNKMNASNPKYVLRNYIAQLVIDEANKGDYSLLNKIYTMLQKPYDEQPEFEK